MQLDSGQVAGLCDGLFIHSGLYMLGLLMDPGVGHQGERHGLFEALGSHPIRINRAKHQNRQASDGWMHKQPYMNDKN